MSSAREKTFASGNLWSLWEMKELGLRRMTLATDMLASLRTTLVYSVQTSLLNDEHYRRSLLGYLDDLEAEIKNLQLGGVSISESIKRVRFCIKPDFDRSYLADKLHELTGRLYDELQGVHALTLSYQERQLYEGVEPLFGEEVQKNFPSLAYEIDEAGKCLALGRSTAAAFHMLRCLEAAMRAISRCLGIPDPIKGTDRNWGNVLREMKGEIDKRWPVNLRVAGDGVLFERFQGTLEAMKNPYRNSTMHLEEKYTPDEARSLLEIVRGLLASVAARMDENGEPKV